MGTAQADVEERGALGFRVVLLVCVSVAIASAIYLVAAPLDCRPHGYCKSLLGSYRPDPPGHVFALVAGLVIGSLIFLIGWLVFVRDSIWVRNVLVFVVALGIGVSLLSQSVLFVIGPALGGLLLWVLLRGTIRRRNPE